MHLSHSVRRGALALAASAALVFGGFAPASAHVGVKADSTDAGSRAIVTFGFGHGCGDSPTTSLAIQIPEEFTSVTPVFAPGWTIEKQMEPLETPVSDGHGGEITERVKTVVFTADEPIENGLYAMVSLRMALPEDAAGETIFFPVVQSCEEGENAWIEIPEEGQDPHDLDSPAPGLKITEPEADHAH